MSTHANPVRAVTPDEANQRIDDAIRARVYQYASRGRIAIDRRIDELEREWDIERYLETTAASFTLAGVALGAAKDARWLVLPGVVAAFLLQHAIQGWCPPAAVFRRLGVRTRQEIERERYAMKALRGDFDGRGTLQGAPDTALDAVGLPSRSAPPAALLSAL